MSEAFAKARDADPISRFGGIIGLNRIVDVKTAQEIIVKGSLYHAIIAPEYEPEALQMLQERSGWGEDLRILETGIALRGEGSNLDLKRVSGGLLVQDTDVRELRADELKVVTQRQPTDTEIEDLLFAWQCVKHVKSNAITVAKAWFAFGRGRGADEPRQQRGIGFETSGRKCARWRLASDAFFPFDDGPAAAAKAGIKAIIQPGGSNRDADSIALCDREGLAMVFTGVRHFKH